MKIQFCDLCNESVPQADLDEGRAVLRGGRVVCAACEAAMSAGGPPAAGPGAETQSLPKVGEDTTIVDPGTVGSLSSRRPSSRGGLGAALGSLALLGVVAAAAYLHDWIGKHEEAMQRGFEAQQRTLSGRLSALEGQMTSREQSASSRVGLLANAVREMQGRLDELSTETEEARSVVSAALERIDDRTDELQGVSAELARQADELDKLARTTGSLHDDVLRLVGRIRDLEEGGAFGSAPVAPPTTAPGVPEVPDWIPLLGDLASEDAGTRWQAVQALGATRDPAVTPELIPLLGDPDLFVRMATARILGDLESREAIPALIDALEDPEASVREAVVVALRSISGKSFRFDPAAKESDRARRIREWRDWWKKEERAGGSS